MAVLEHYVFCNMIDLLTASRSDMRKIFPFGMFHLGGDEVYTGWSFLLPNKRQFVSMNLGCWHVATSKSGACILQLNCYIKDHLLLIGRQSCVLVPNRPNSDPVPVKLPCKDGF
jgi:hypothetical protein